MAQSTDGRVMATAENGMPIYKSTDALFTEYYKNQLRKTAGGMGYATAGAVNPIYGQFISAVVFASDNIYTALGVKQWDKSGVRVQTSLAKKGGIGTDRGGAIPTSVRPDLAMVKQPHKELPFSFNYDIGLIELENKDDTITWQNYIEIQGRTYSDGLDVDLLRPTEESTPTKKGEEIQIEKLSRLIASNVEVGKQYNTLGNGATTVTASMVTPYGGTASDLYPYRSAGVSAFDSYVDNNETTVDLADLDKAWSGCAPYWANSASPQGKMWAMSFEMQRRIGGLLSASNRYMESVFTVRDINGVSTVPGRDVGFVTKAYNDIAIITDGNINVDVTTQTIPMTHTPLGDTFLLDLDHIWYKALRPVDFRTTDRYEIYDQLTNKAVYFMEGEVCTDSWRGSAKITQKQ